MKALCAALLLPVLAIGQTPEDRPKPPAQAERGPGGKEFDAVEVRRSMHGSGATQYWIYEPVRTKAAAAEKLPLVIFLHGFSVMSPSGYEAWLTHLAQRGNIVIYPRYQDSLFTPPNDFYANSAASVRDALALFAKEHAPIPDLARVAVVGHSAGGVGALTYAARAKGDGLPVPRCVMAVQPGQGMENSWQILTLDDYSKLDPETRMIVQVGDVDRIVGSASARRIWTRSAHVKTRALLTVQSDDHGAPSLRANHLSPLVPDLSLADAVDFFAYWRTFDALLEDTFANRPFRVETSMGEWSDGTAVKPMKVE